MSKLFRIVPAALVAGGLVFAGSGAAQAAPVRKATVTKTVVVERKATVDPRKASVSAKKGGDVLDVAARKAEKEREKER